MRAVQFTVGGVSPILSEINYQSLTAAISKML